jgi:hypothetical protein
MAEFRLGGSRWGVCGWVGVYGVGGRVGDDGVMVGCFFCCKPLLVHSMHAKALDGHPQDGKVSCKTKPVSCFFLQAGSGPTGRCKKKKQS